MNTENTNVLQTQQPADEVVTALTLISTKYTQISGYRDHARALHERYKDVAFDVTTAKGMREATEARHKFRSEARFPLQTAQKEISKQLGEMRSQLNEACDKIGEEILGYEEPINQQIKAQEEVKRAEAEEKTRKEVERLAVIEARITRIGTEYTVERGTLAELIDAKLQALNAEIADAKEEDFAELLPRAQAAYKEARERLTTMLQDQREREELAEQRRAMEAQQEALRQQAAALERQQREAQEAADKKDREDREASEREQRAADERAQAVEQRIQYFRTLPGRLQGAASGNLETNIRTLNDTLVLPGDYGDRQQEAQQALQDALAQLRSMFEVKRDAENAAAEEQRQRDAAAQSQREREAEERRQQEEALQAQLREQSAAPALRAVVEQALALGDTLLSDVFGSDWLRDAKAAMAVVRGEQQEEPAEEVAEDAPAAVVADSAVRAAVLKVVSNCFEIPEGDHLLALRFGNDLANDSESMSVMVEELGYALPDQFPDGMPLALAGQIVACQDVAGVVAVIEEATR